MFKTIIVVGAVVVTATITLAINAAFTYKTSRDMAASQDKAYQKMELSNGGKDYLDKKTYEIP